jgi:hypothetical protein
VELWFLPDYNCGRISACSPVLVVLVEQNNQSVAFGTQNAQHLLQGG